MLYNFFESLIIKVCTFLERLTGRYIDWDDDGIPYIAKFDEDGHPR
ncbi:MAG: hypothetical protein BroJett005_31620 [Ignavibacteriota bacterium]|nr:MAG: hypothetical protein BroJett005_31620 [Ignavibacteriota bacterium]